MSYLRLIKLSPPASLLRRRVGPLFSDPFFSDPFFTSQDWFRPISYKHANISHERQIEKMMNEMIQDMNEMREVFEILMNPEYEQNKKRKALKEAHEGENQKEKVKVESDNLTANSDPNAVNSNTTNNTNSTVNHSTTRSNDDMKTPSNGKSTSDVNNRSSEGATIKTSSQKPATESKNNNSQDITAKNHHNDDLNYFSLFPSIDLFTNTIKPSNSTYARAEKLLNHSSSPSASSSADAESQTKPSNASSLDLTLEESDDLLKGNTTFAHLFTNSNRANSNTKITGSSYESSTIFRNGKAVTVSKHSTLGPDGKVRTEVKQEYKDSKGESDKRSWVKEEELGETYGKKTEAVKEETKKSVEGL